MALWIQMSKKEVLGEVNYKCSECGWDNWQSPYWWDVYANYCPQCGTKMEFERRPLDAARTMSVEL